MQKVKIYIKKKKKKKKQLLILNAHKFIISF